MAEAPLIDVYAAAQAVDVPASTIRRWAHEGRITRQGTDNHRRALYSLTDITRTADQLRR